MQEFFLCAKIALLLCFIYLLYRTFRRDATRSAEINIKITAPFWLLWVVLLVVIFGLDGVLAAREAARRASCISNNKFIGMDMQIYRDEHGNFPPAYSIDEKGQPLYSWRLLILEHEEYPQIQKAFKLDEPWNSPQNQKAVDIMPSGMGNSMRYECPSNTNRGKHDTDFVMPIGPECISDGPTGRKLEEISDGTSHTIVNMEMAASGIHWMEPKDLNMAEMSFKINDSTKPSIRSMHPHTANANFADGSVRVLRDDIDPKVLKALLTISGNEAIPQDTN